MNLIDNRTKHERLYDGLIAAFDELQEAEKAVAEAESKIKGIWIAHCDQCVATTHLRKHLIESERVIIQDGSWIYQIDFDVDDWTTPSINRIERYTKIYKPNR